MTREGRAFAIRLAVLAAVGVELRALYLFTVGYGLTGIGDWFFYHNQANQLAEGKGFLDSLFGWPSAGHPPLYPLALSVVSLLGGTSEIAHRSLGLLTGAATILLVGLLGRRAGGDRLGLTAAGLCAVSPLMIAVDGALMSETLYGPMVALALLAAWNLWETPGPWTAVVSGAAIALAALTRAEALLLLPLLAWPLAWRAGDRLQRAGNAAVATLGFVLVLAPWTIRNAITLGGFVPISSNNATVIAGSNCVYTYGGINIGLWDMRCFSSNRGQSELEQAELWRAEGLAYARDHASELPEVMTVRLLRVWDLWQTGRQTRFAEGRLWQMVVASVGVYFVSMGLAVVGALELRRRRRPLWILLAPAVLVSVVAIVGYGLPRLRHAFEIPLLVLAAAGLLRGIDRARAVPRSPAPVAKPE